MTRPRKDSAALPPELATPDVIVASAAVLDQVAELRTEVARLAEIRMRPAEPEVTIGTCRYCGVGVREPEILPPICEICHRAMPFFDITDIFDRDTGVRESWRRKVFESILGQVPVMDALEAGVIFWDELPPKEQVRGPHRWAHLGDFGAIRRKNILARKTLELEIRMNSGPKYLDGDPCARCGCAHLFVSVPEMSGGGSFVSDGTATIRISHGTIPAHLKCMGCSDRPGDFGTVLAGLLGVRFLNESDVRTQPMRAGMVMVGNRSVPASEWGWGIGWYADLAPNDTKRRKLTRCPWEHFGIDLHELRCRAMREFAPLPEHWRSRALFDLVRSDPRSVNYADGETP